MRRLLLVLAVLVATSSPSQADEFWRDSGQACFFGATVLGISAAMLLYPAVASAATTLPATTLVIGNVVFGCGLAMIGSMAAYGFGAIYDSLASPSESAAAPAKVPVRDPAKSKDSAT
ncbi:MAG: hypothetical protein WCK65_04270 [Rhodospirillaceae bacterium]